MLSPNFVDTSSAPRSRNTSRKDVNIIISGLNLANHDTMMAVNPLPSAVVEAMECDVPPTRRRPVRPHIAPDIAMVRMITFFTLIPM